MTDDAVIWSVVYSDDVVKKDIPKLNMTVKRLIKQAIENKLMKNPIHFGKPLRYSLHHLRSLRVGDYRILYAADYEKYVIFIVSIGHRKDIDKQ